MHSYIIRAIFYEPFDLLFHFRRSSLQLQRFQFPRCRLLLGHIIRLCLDAWSRKQEQMHWNCSVRRPAWSGSSASAAISGTTMTKVNELCIDLKVTVLCTQNWHQIKSDDLPCLIAYLFLSSLTPGFLTPLAVFLQKICWNSVFSFPCSFHITCLYGFTPPFRGEMIRQLSILPAWRVMFQVLNQNHAMSALIPLRGRQEPVNHYLSSFSSWGTRNI